MEKQKQRNTKKKKNKKNVTDEVLSTLSQKAGSLYGFASYMQENIFILLKKNRKEKTN